VHRAHACLKLARQAPYHLNHSISTFCFSYCWDRILLHALAGPDCNPICALDEVLWWVHISSY
jgi:hypothetical protein